MLGNYFSGTFKNTVIKVKAVQTETRGLISGQSANCTIYNVYIESDVTGSKVDHIFANVYGGCAFRNTVVKVKGLTGIIESTTATQSNVVTVTETFFTDQELIKFSSFEEKADGLYFNGKLVLAK